MIKTRRTEEDWYEMPSTDASHDDALQWNPLSASFFAMKLMIARALAKSGETPESFEEARQRFVADFAASTEGYSDEASKASFGEMLKDIGELL